MDSIQSQAAESQTQLHQELVKLKSAFDEAAVYKPRFSFLEKWLRKKSRTYGPMTVFYFSVHRDIFKGYSKSIQAQSKGNAIEYLLRHKSPAEEIKEELQEMKESLLRKDDEMFHRLAEKVDAVLKLT